MGLSLYYQSLEQSGFKSSIADYKSLIEIMANELLALDAQAKIEIFNIGYHVVFQKG